MHRSALLMLAMFAAGATADSGGEAALPPASNLHRYSPRVAFQVWRDGVLEMHSWNAPAEPLAPLVAAARLLRPPQDAQATIAP